MHVSFIHRLPAPALAVVVTCAVVLLVSPCAIADENGTGAEAAAAVQEAERAEHRPAENDVLTTLGTVFDATPWWGWLVLFFGILGGLIVGKITQIILRAASNRLEARGQHIRGLFFYDAASPASLALFTIGLGVGIQFGVVILREVPEVPNPLEPFVDNVLQFLIILAIGWFVYNVIDIVDATLQKFTAGSDNKLAVQLVPLIRKALRIFVVVVFALFIAQNIFGVNITAWLAGLGIAGLAVSLAAQDSVKNLFGSITVLLDKPFAVGDRIQFAGADGFVEEIGFRSTKIRTFFGHLVTVPNMKFIDGTVENVSARSFIRRTVNVTITYDTPPEKIEQAVRTIKDILSEDDLAAPFNVEERPPRVYFNDYNADSLNIAVNYWYFLDEEKGQDWWGYLEHGELFNLRLFRAFGEAGIDFAFPTQTLYLAGDPDRQLAVRVLGDPAKQAD